MGAQEDALAAAPREKIFREVQSVSVIDRKGIQKAMAYARKGDVPVVWKLDRLDLITVVEDLLGKGIGFRSLQEQMDTTSSGGQLIFHIFGALAESERPDSGTCGVGGRESRGRQGGAARVRSRRTPSWQRRR